MHRIVERLVKFEEWENKYREPLSKQLNEGKEVVRCQDCKYWVYNFNGCSRNPCTEPWYATDFCNYGEREDE